MALTKEKLVSILKTDDFKSVHSLKLDGLELTSCFKLLLQEFGVSLYILNLKNNSIPEVDIILGFTNLRKLDLSTNLISNVGSPDLWGSMPRLQILYLHDNLLEDFSTFTSLSALPSILHLTLFNNPCIHLPDYRKFMINALPTLLALDFYISNQEEREEILMPDAEKAKIWIQDTSDPRNFRQHLYKLRRKWEKCSPIIKIQSLWRRYCVRKHIGGHLSERDKNAVIIQKHVRGWLLRKKLKKDLEQLLKDTNNEELLYTPEEYIQYKAVRRIEEWFKVYKEKKKISRKRSHAITKISAAYRKYKICKMKLEYIDVPKIYVLKSQQRTLICFLRAMAKDSSDVYHPANMIQDRMAPEFFEGLPKKTSGPSFAELFLRIIDCKKIKLIRFPDIDNLKYVQTPILQIVKWVPFTKAQNSNFDRPITKISISQKFCRKNEYEKLKKFKNRGFKISKKEKEELKDIAWNFDDYLDLLEFEAPNVDFLREMIMMILDYNKYVESKDLTIFVPIYAKLLERVKAACTIQSCWRGHLVRKNSNLFELAIKRRAVLSIQRWWRFQRFEYRMNSLTRLKETISCFTSPIVYLQEHFFQDLSESLNNFTFTEQNFSFFCKGDTVFISKMQKNGFKLLPNWVGVQIWPDRGAFSASSEEKTLQALILSGANVEIVQLNSQIKEPKVANPHLKFLKLEYRSIEEVKRRAAVLYLKTLENRFHSFIPFLTIDDLNHPFLMSKLRNLWNLRGINSNKECQALEILKKALSPIENIIKVNPTPPPIFRPRHSERNFEIISEIEVAPPRNAISSQELLRKRVQKAREENQRRQIESRISKQIDMETKVGEIKEKKEQIYEILQNRQGMQMKQIELKKNFIEAQARKKEEVKNERKFVVQFAQAKNMLQKLMKNSDMTRWRNKSRQDIREKVETFKQKSKERKEFIQSMLYEKYKSKGNKTAIV